jgi:hydroxyacylglutathione hydrolase
MLLKRFYNGKLAQASYMLGCQATGEALVVDPNREIEQYVEAAKGEGVRITHVTETHIHADFVSGARELAERTGATLYLSDEGGAEWKYGFAAEAGAVLLRDGDRIQVGNIRVDVLHTPGHTPEHLTFLVTDTLAADRPMGAFTGDFIFVGDVGRPDLLETAAKQAGTMEAGAKTLFGSLQKFKQQPDYLQLWPGHGAGSACGKALGAVPQSTLGYERLFNWGLATETEIEFVQAVLAGQPEPPMYFAEMKRINRDGPRVLGSVSQPPRLAESRLPGLLQDGAVVIDTRPGADFAAGHLPRSLSTPFNKSFTTYAGSVVPFDRDLYLVVDSRHEGLVEQIVRDLSLIGLDRVSGYFTSDAVALWAATEGALSTLSDVTPEEVEHRLDAGEIELVDVRNSSEWQAGHIGGSRNVPLGRLAERLEEIPRDRPLVVHCLSGARAGVAASLLQQRGFRDVVHLKGDYQEWSRSGRPVETAEPAQPAAARGA